jgi:hypothetical protein
LINSPEWDCLDALLDLSHPIKVKVVIKTSKPAINLLVLSMFGSRVDVAGAQTEGPVRMSVCEAYAELNIPKEAWQLRSFRGR